jgi:hypothetical protein
MQVFNYFKRKRQLAAESKKHALEPLPHNRPLWQDINQFFKELFLEAPDLQKVQRTPETLMADLEARFHGNYTLEEIRKMCEMGYPRSDEGYRFSRTDFILPKTN